MTNIWKTMEVGKVYETLAKMTPEERLANLKKDTDELLKKIKNCSTSSMQKTEKEIIDYIENYIEDYKEEYEDKPFPDESMLQDANAIIHDMIEDERFYKLIKELMRNML